ncbi:hypothetical protein ACFWN1_12665 [Streptomyces sp. NPDC058459]|uniref:hypothetical protein n=1 Tax=Streptomyces sp. NPDC058459 TaxID=3346508 RepID=UPI0036498B48
MMKLSRRTVSITVAVLVAMGAGGGGLAYASSAESAQPADVAPGDPKLDPSTIVIGTDVLVPETDGGSTPTAPAGTAPGVQGTEPGDTEAAAIPGSPAAIELEEDAPAVAGPAPEDSTGPGTTAPRPPR